MLFFSVHLYDSARDCPNCLPSELRPSNGNGGNGGGGKDIGGGLKRPSAPPGIDEFEFYPGTVRRMSIPHLLSFSFVASAHLTHLLGLTFRSFCGWVTDRELMTSWRRTLSTRR